MARIAFQTLLRAACVSWLEDYATAASLKLQVYPGRPTTLYPPSAFVDRIDESVNYSASLRQRHPIAQVVIVWGLFDSAEAVAQRDAFVDGLLDEITDDPHGISPATLAEGNNIQDEPVFNPDWGSEAQRNTSYYATRFFVEGLALEGD